MPTSANSTSCSSDGGIAVTERTSAGLRGINAGETAICTVGAEHAGLRYRGYDIRDLAQHACFEEVAYLLLRR